MAAKPKTGPETAFVWIANTSSRLITISMRRTNEVLARRIRLLPGANMVNAADWAEAKKLAFTQANLDEGTLSEEKRDVAKAKKVTAAALKEVGAGKQAEDAANANLDAGSENQE